MSSTVLWLTVLAAGVATYLLRLSFIAILGRVGVPGWLEEPLRYVAPAVFAAIVVPPVLLDDTGSVEVISAKVAAAIAAAAVAAWRRNLGLAIGVGLVTLWVLQAVGG